MNDMIVLKMASVNVAMGLWCQCSWAVLQHLLDSSVAFSALCTFVLSLCLPTM